MTRETEAFKQFELTPDKLYSFEIPIIAGPTNMIAIAQGQVSEPLLVRSDQNIIPITLSKIDYFQLQQRGRKVELKAITPPAYIVLDVHNRLAFPHELKVDDIVSVMAGNQWRFV